MNHISKRAGQKNAPKPRTAVIYARFSCSKQREASIEDQLRVCQEWCRDNDHEVVATYCDYAISGRTDERPEFQRMIENAGESEIVLVYMMDRFSRDAYDAPVYKRRLRDHGVRVVSATEAMPDGPEAILLEKVYEGLAAIESAHISQRTRRGMEGNALKCMHNGVRVFGYDFGDDGRYVVNEAEAEVVREVFRRRREGDTANAIATDLAHRGYRTSMGNPVGHTWVCNMLKNEKYAGVYVFGSVRVEGGMPQIISRKEWDVTQTVKARKQRKTEQWREYPLAGRAFCGCCGYNLVGTSAYGRAKARYDYYRCRQKCGCKPVRADWLEGRIVEALRELLADRDEALRLAERVREVVATQADTGRIDDARRRKAAAERAVRNLTDAVAQGMPYADVRDQIEEYKLQVGAISAEIAMLEHHVELDVDQFADFLQFGATLTDDRLLDAFVSQVMVTDELVVVALNIDANENREPVRLTLDRVRDVLVWLPSVPPVRNGRLRLGADDGNFLLIVPRAA